MKKKFAIGIILMFYLNAYLASTVTVMATAIESSETQATNKALNDLKQSNAEPDTYHVTIQYYGESGTLVEKVIAVTIKGENTVVNGDEVIDASDAVVSPDKVISYGEEDWILATGAHAWDKKTKAVIPIKQVDATSVKAEEGVYPLIIKTERGTQTAVNITVVGKLFGMGLEDEGDNSLQQDIKWGKSEIAIGITFSLIVILFIAIPVALLSYQQKKIKQLSKAAYHLLREK